MHDVDLVEEEDRSRDLGEGRSMWEFASASMTSRVAVQSYAALPAPRLLLPSSSFPRPLY